MSSTSLLSPFPTAPLDVVIANETGAYKSIGNLGEAFLGTLLQDELAPLQQAHKEGVDTFHEVLAAAVAEVADKRAAIGDEPLAGDFCCAIARSCVVLAYGANHRLRPHLMAFLRHRMGRHLLARPSLVRELMEANAAFAATFERSLARVASISGRQPTELLVADDVATDAKMSSCAFCDTTWPGEMPNLQLLPALVEKLEGADALTSTRESVMVLSGAYYQVSLDGDTPLQQVCSHYHVIDKLVDDRHAVFDPWLGELAVGFFEPELESDLYLGWKKY